MGLSEHSKQILNDPKYKDAAAQIIAAQQPGQIAEMSQHAKDVQADPIYEAARQTILESQAKTKAKIKAEQESTQQPGQIAGLSAHAIAVRDDPKYKEAAKKIISKQQVTKAILAAQAKEKEKEKPKTGPIAGLSAHAIAVRDDPKYKEAAAQIIAAQQVTKERIKFESEGIVRPSETTADSSSALAQLKDYKVKGDYYDIKGYLKDKGGAGIATLRQAGFDWGSLQGASSQNLAEAEQEHKLATTPITSQIWQGMTPWDESVGETATAAGVGIMAAELIIPGVYTARHWDEMSDAEKAFSISMDVLALLPVAGAAARGARTVGVASRGARLTGALKGVGREVVAQVMAPIDLVIHPIASTTSAASSVKNLIENIFHPTKIPEAVLTTSDGVVRIRVGKDMTAAKALKVRDDLMRLAQEKGVKPVVEIGGQKVELTRSPFMKEAGGLVHATPDIGMIEGVKIKGTPGMPKEETGWFVSHEPAIDFTKRAAHGLGEIPVSSKASGKVIDIGKYRPGELVYLDKAPIKPLNLADAVNVPDVLADPLMDYIKLNDGTIYGSLNEWVKVKGALQPNDIDVIFKNSEKAIEDIIEIAEKNGFKARRAPHAVEILVDDEWVQLADIASDSSHTALDVSRGLPSHTVNTVDGVKVETLGKQYIGQSYGTVSKSEKAALRSKKLNKAAGDVKKMIKEAGISKKEPGIFVISPESAQKTVSSNKLYKSWADGLVAEMERKIKVGEIAPKVRQKLFTRVGPNNQRVAIYIEKPLTRKQILKLKGLALIEDLKQPFRPAIKVSGVGDDIGRVSAAGMDDIIDTLRASGNIDQADALLMMKRAPSLTERVAPRPLNNIVGRVGGRQAAGAGKRAKAEVDRTTTKDRGRTPTTEEPRTPRGKDATTTPERARTSTPDDERTPTPRPPRVEEPRPRKPRITVPERTPRIPREEERQRATRAPRTRMARKDRVRKPMEESKARKMAILFPQVAGEKPGVYQAPEGSVTHAQGIGWWTYFPPYGQQDRKFTMLKPHGAIEAKDMKSAIATIQSMGEAEGKLASHYDMGIMDVKIKKPPKTPSVEKGRKAIKFVRDVDKTYGKLRKQNRVATHAKKPKGKKGRVGPYYYNNGAMSRKPFTQ